MFFKRWRKKIEFQVEYILALVKEIRSKEKIMSAQMDALKVQAQATVDGIGKAVVLIGQLAAGKEDPVAIQAITDQLKLATDALNAIVTPPAPPVA
jgi:hypothetical protein